MPSAKAESALVPGLALGEWIATGWAHGLDKLIEVNALSIVQNSDRRINASRVAKVIDTERPGGNGILEDVGQRRFARIADTLAGS